MITFKQFIAEAPPTEELASKVYYHGTSSEAAGLGIIKHGIKPGDLAAPDRSKGGKGPNLAPVAGKVYVTADLGYAQMYAIGGDMAGSTSWKPKDERYGYLFVIDGSQLVDVRPDEDSIGELVAAELRKPSGNEIMRRVASMVVSILTPGQLRKLKNDEYVMYAHAGKKVMKQLSDSEKIGLIALGAHVAHTGVLQPKEAWKLDLHRLAELKRDGSTFFKVAEKV